MSAENCRERFAKAFEQYAQEGARMRDLLLSRNGSSESRDSQSISDQQVRLNEARTRYEEARCRYVEFVLKGYVDPGESV
jgi:hypothetical protein